MTDYTVITDSQVDPDAPITSGLGYAWRDNPIAIAEGAPGAPRINQGAIDRVSAGNSIRWRADAEFSGATASTITSPLIPIMQVGTVRITFDHRTSPGTAGSASVIRRRAGGDTSMASFANSTTYVSRTVDVSVLPGDNIFINVSSGATISPFYRNFRLGTNNQNFWSAGAGASFIEGNVYL